MQRKLNKITYSRLLPVNLIQQIDLHIISWSEESPVISAIDHFRHKIQS